MYDVLVIGGGPAGLMASVSAAESGARVLLVDKGKKLGRKLLISGGGRCNVTNNKPMQELVQYLPGNGKFLYSTLSRFNHEDIIDFFENLGISVKEEDRGRMFPVSDTAKSVVAALLQRMDDLGVEQRLQTEVDHILVEDHNVQGLQLTSGEEITAAHVILAVGGKSVPGTGSTGDGYAWAEACGHTITDLYPTEVPLTSDEAFIRDGSLQGLSLRDAAVSVLNHKGKKITTHQWDLLFTHQGLSGPAVLRCSQFVVKELKKHPEKQVTVTIDVMPEENVETIHQALMKKSERYYQKKLIFN